MASHGRDIAHTAGEITGQAQIKKDEFDDFVNQASQGAWNKTSDNTHSSQSPTMTTQATNFLQQTGEQVKNMAQGAADAVKSTLGMNADSPNSPNTTNYNTSSTNHPSNPTNRRL